MEGNYTVQEKMKRFETGDPGHVDIPDERDPDHARLHGRRGTVVQIISDDADDVTGDSREGFLYRVDLDNEETVDVRWRDLRPV